MKQIIILMLALLPMSAYAQVPASPTAYAATSVTTGSFVANWSAVAGATSYRIDVATDAAFTNIHASYNNQSTSGTTSTPVYSAIAAGTNYYYRIRAVNASGSSASSNVITVLIAAATPTATVASNFTASSFTANWTPPTGTITGYRIDVSAVSNFSSMVSGFNNLAVSGTSVNVTGLSANVAYYYRVRAENGSGPSGNSSTITTRTLYNPPVALAATPSWDSFLARWQGQLSNYYIDVSMYSDFSGMHYQYDNRLCEDMYSAEDGQARATNLSPGQTYYYRIRRNNASGPSGNSNTITVLLKPAAPYLNSTTNIANTSFTANWTECNGATDYRIDVSTNSAFSSFVSGYQDLSTSGALTKTITGLTANTTYYYRVRAVNASGSSPSSTTGTQLTSLLPTPASFDAIAASVSTITVKWGTVSGATGYRIDVSTSQYFTYTVSPYNNYSTASLGSPTSTTGIVNTNLQPGTVYYYRFKAINSSGSSGYSTVRTGLTYPAQPTLLPVSNKHNISFVANWSPVQSATGYYLDVATSSGFSPATMVSGFNNLLVTGTSKEVVGLTGGNIYYYRVRAVNGSGLSVNSTTGNTTTLVVPTPVATTASNVLPYAFTANWNSISGATGYQIDVSKNIDFSSFVSVYNSLNTQSLSYVAGTSGVVDNLITSSTTFYYRIRATNGANVSGNSNIITVTTGIGRNYLVSSTIQVPGIKTSQDLYTAPVSHKNVLTKFVDDLGRPAQTVTWKGSPAGYDIVQPVSYDDFDRESKKYLPYVSSEQNGLFKADALKDPQTTETTEIGKYRSGKQYLFYQNGGLIAQDQYPYAETVYESSPLNRVIKSGATGASWQPDGVASYTSTDHTVKTSYGFNQANEVILWTYTYPDATYLVGKVNSGSGSTPVYYGVNTLTKNKVKDEEGNEIIEYTDKSGKMVLKRVQAVSGSVSVNNTNYASIYYIYDAEGNLVTVIPPEATKLITQTSPVSEYFNKTDLEKENFMSRWAFRYAYDSRNRMSIKQVPGAGAVYMVYDKRDRLVLTQDANQRVVGRWTFTKYDALNRPILTGIKDTTAISQSVMQDAVNTWYDLASNPWRTYGEKYSSTGTVHGYTNTSYPKTTSPVALDVNRFLTVTYYDNYDFKSSWVGLYNYVNEGLSKTVNGVSYNQPALEFLKVKGLVTGTKVKVLDGGVSGGYTWLKTVNYYDNKYRVIQTQSDNYKGGTDKISNLYDFVGKILKSKAIHVEQDPSWQEMTYVKQEGNKLISISGAAQWGFGARSVEVLPAGQDGWFEVTVTETNTTKIIGFNDSNSGGTSNSDMNYAFQLYNTTLYVQENSSLKATVAGIKEGDVLRMERTGTAITFKRNGQAITTSAITPSTTALFIDNSFHIGGNTLAGIRSSFSTTSRTVTRTFDYDHAGRLLSTWHRLDKGSQVLPPEILGTEILLNKNEYNELGQLIDKKLHSTIASGADAKQSVDYRYNIRGWLSSMNNAALSNDGTTNNDTGDFFGMNLAYHTTDLGVGNTPVFNGNISGITWSNNQGLGTTKQNGYVYTYDAMNRISTSAFKEKSSSWTELTANANAETGFLYDLNGNIENLQRNDKRTSGLMMDILDYDYGTGAAQSNKLLKVTDTGDDFTGFIDGNPGTTNDYTYDDNGNLTTDLNKGISTAIVYNFLNLPAMVTKGSNSINYIYDATGRKLTQVTRFGGTSKQTDYAGEYQYENDVLQYIAHEEGRIVMAETKMVYTHGADVVTGITASNATLAPVTQNGTEKYVRATANGTVARTGMNPIGSTLYVNAGETYRIRAKGYRTGADAVYLLIKVNGADMNWPGATLANGATAESWTEQTVTIPASPATGTLEVGLVWNTVTSGQQFFLNAFEIIKVSTSTVPEYQYNLKDHLGNNRLTFTTKVETLVETATLENAKAATEQAQFLRFAEAKKIQSALFDRTNGGLTGYSQRLNGSANERYGLGKSISVMPGDVINAEVYAKYVDPASIDPNTSAGQALLALLQAISQGSAGVVVDGANYMGSTSSFPFSAAAVQNTSNSSENGPKAYLNWLVFDRDFNFILSESGYDRLTTGPKEIGNDVTHERLYSPAITIKQAGYVYIYLSNEESSPLEVYFDDFKVTHTKSPVIQTDDYYAFGLIFNSYQRENSVSNQYLYNGKEKQDELDLGWLDYGARMYQPELGKFFTQDRFAEKYHDFSPYQYAALNPIKYIDVNGDSTYLIIFGSGHLNPNAKGQANDVGEGFKKNAEARAEQLRKNLQKGDEVIVVNATTEDEYVNALNASYSSGVIKQLDVYSHGTNNSINLGGPESGGPTETTDADKDYRLVSGFTSAQNPNGDDETARINPSNFSSNATINLWGCNLGGTNSADITSGANHAQYMANSLGGNVTVNAFNGGGGAEFKQSGGKNVYDGTMIRSADRNSQRTIQTAYKPR